jgi:hypothetical protein
MRSIRVSLTLLVVAMVTLNVFAGPLHDAATRGDLATVESIIKTGVSVNARDESGLTALHYASWKGHPRIVKVLLASGAEVDAKEPRNGWTALYVAAREGHEEVTKALLAAGADMNAAKQAIPIPQVTRTGYVKGGKSYDYSIKVRTTLEVNGRFASVDYEIRTMGGGLIESSLDNSSAKYVVGDKASQITANGSIKFLDGQEPKLHTLTKLILADDRNIFGSWIVGPEGRWQILKAFALNKTAR